MGKLFSLMQLLQGTFAALLLVVIGAVLMLFAAPALIRVYQSQTWANVTGKIVESRWQNKLIGQNASATRPVFRFVPQIEYSYNVNGTEYRSTTVSLGAFDELDKNLAKSKLEQYSIGREVVVHFNPAKPQDSCLEPAQPALGMILGLLASVVAFYGAFVMLRQRHNPQSVAALSTARYGNEKDYRAALEAFAKKSRS